ncbi:hypothetical protein C1645_819542 [Glomus cerebriforme]|uniref:30S ribosomal protein S13 n=1 Tax=Glomus cerebriforme TaxID=658196 RepID=A0A397T4S8_9GLOM|nr:hypothetical protein C1645_819542 [Glomus cerebriforme]
MVSIKGQEIPNNKNIFIALTYIYGIGRQRAEEIVKECELRNEIKQIIDAQIKLGNYRGKRRSQKPNPLPIRAPSPK